MKKRYLASASAALLVGAAVIPSGASAEVATKNLQAKYNNIKVLYNGYQVSTPIEPFIVNGTTYIPLRMMAGVFNKDVSWDGNTYTINVTDRPDASTQAQLAAKDAEIKRLQDRIASLQSTIEDLEEEIDDLENDDGDLDDWEDELNDEFEDYFDDIELKIKLDGDEDDIEVEVQVDLDDYEDEWDDLDEDDIEDLVIDLVEYIWDEFNDEAYVEGVIIDVADDDDLYDFEGDPDEGEILLDDEVIKD